MRRSGETGGFGSRVPPVVCGWPQQPPATTHPPPPTHSPTPHPPPTHLYPLAFHWLYTCSSVRWSLSGTKNFSRAASLSSARSGGRKKTVGTLSTLTMVRTSEPQPIAAPASSILASGGSRGNSTMWRPVSVSALVLSSAPRIWGARGFLRRGWRVCAQARTLLVSA